MHAPSEELERGQGSAPPVSDSTPEASSVWSPQHAGRAFGSSCGTVRKEGREGGRVPDRHSGEQKRPSDPIFKREQKDKNKTQDLDQITCRERPSLKSKLGTPHAYGPQSSSRSSISQLFCPFFLPRTLTLLSPSSNVQKQPDWIVEVRKTVAAVIPQKCKPPRVLCNFEGHLQLLP